MTKLSQIVAVEKDVKTKGLEHLTQAHRTLAHPEPLSGIARTYQPKNDDDQEMLPSETKYVQVTVPETLALIKEHLVRHLDVEATRDWGNQIAHADVEVDGKVLVADAPVEYLLALEKWLVGVQTFVTQLPVLDPSEKWTWSDQEGVYVNTPAQTVRSKKVPRNHVRAEATKEHPAQVDLWQEDVPVGTWTTVKKSGAITFEQKRAMVERVAALQRAVKVARQTANGTEIADKHVGEPIVDYIFAL